jgi:hypothetical protein
MWQASTHPVECEPPWRFLLEDLDDATFFLPDSQLTRDRFVYARAATGEVMPLIPVLSGALVAVLAIPVSAQEWFDFKSQLDRFSCNFPSQPTVTETVYESEYGSRLPARVYTAADGQSRYSMTVVDYSDTERQLAERAKNCVEDAVTCKRNLNNVESRAQLDRVGAITYATGRLIDADVRVTMLVTSWMDWVEGHHLQFVNNADMSKTSASIYMHEDKLYIMVGTVPPGYPEPALFQDSLGFLDEKGQGIRYRSLYRNGFPAPPRQR